MQKKITKGVLKGKKEAKGVAIKTKNPLTAQAKKLTRKMLKKK